MAHAGFEGFCNGFLLVVLVLPRTEAEGWDGGTGVQFKGSHFVLGAGVYGTCKDISEAERLQERGEGSG